jgi:hypothetical protein
MFLIGAATGLSAGELFSSGPLPRLTSLLYTAAVDQASLPGGNASRAGLKVNGCVLWALLPPFPAPRRAVATVFLAVFSLVDDRHRLRSERLQPRTGSKGAMSWLGAQAAKVRKLCGWGVWVGGGTRGAHMRRQPAYSHLARAGHVMWKRRGCAGPVKLVLAGGSWVVS